MPHHKLLLVDIFRDLCKRKRVSNKQWHKCLGQLRFVAEAIPGSEGLFCTLQLALNKARGNWVCITRSLRRHLDTFASLAASLGNRPTHLVEIMLQRPSHLGTTDAAKAGMGGVYYCPEGKPHVWRCPFPKDTQD